jgi:peptide chain release factor 2
MEDIKKRLKAIKKSLGLDKKRNDLERLEKIAASADFWKDKEQAQEVMRQIAEIREELGEVEAAEQALERGEGEEAEKLTGRLELKTYLSAPYDRSDAILSIHAGQGGTEAQDWAAMLARMYQRFSESRGWKVRFLERRAGEEAGFKSVVLEVRGAFAFGYLKGEAGVHRLVRQSPFNAQALRQTSFALVETAPVLEEVPEVELKGEDLDIQTFRSSGPGGQNVQKVETAVRVKHRPSGIVVSSQEERSQARNKQIALKLLKARLFAKAEEKRKKQELKLKGAYVTPGWGNQIRSYVLHPYKQVKDLRTGYQSKDPEAVLNGGLEDFVEAELRWEGKEP